MTWQASNLPKEKHCFFGRNGGVSTGKYTSFNFNEKSLDNPQNIAENYKRLASFYGLDSNRVVRLSQGVSNKVVYTTEPSIRQLEADGVVTDCQDLILTISTADCAPVLLADYKNGIIGAAHGGWRSFAKGIIENTINLMIEKGAKIENIAAAIGPCIQQASFEVGPEVFETFVNQDSQNQAYFIPSNKENHWLFDLSGCIEYKLHKLGITNTENSKIDTYKEENNYFSYRRDTHKGLITTAGDFPVELSTIIL